MSKALSQQQEWERHPYASLYAPVVYPLYEKKEEAGNTTSPVVSFGKSDEKKNNRKQFSDIISLLRRKDFDVDNFHPDGEMEPKDNCNSAGNDKREWVPLPIQSTDVARIVSYSGYPIGKLQKRLREAPKRAKIAATTPSVVDPDDTSVSSRQSNESRKTRKVSQKLLKKRNDQWMNMYNRLVAFKQRHDTCLIGIGNKEDPQLASWVRTQRKQCKAQERVALLDKIGFVWSVRRTYTKVGWKEMYNRLVEFKKKHGTTDVRQIHDDARLYKWVQNQRQKCKDKERLELLGAIGFVLKKEKRMYKKRKSK